jgi:hypothetical protein
MGGAPANRRSLRDDNKRTGNYNSNYNYNYNYNYRSLRG